MDNKPDEKTEQTEQTEQTKQTFKRLWKRLQRSYFFKIVNFISNSAAIALLITGVLFVYQEHEERERTEKITSDLLSVQQGLSTRYLGIFPEYIGEVNNMFKQCAPKDTIIIFEDVLYYGFTSKPEEFIKAAQLLLSHADAGGSVTIVHYDEDEKTFHRMIREELIPAEYYDDIARERNEQGLGLSIEQLKSLDSTLCNHYFNLSREKNPEKLKTRVRRNLDARLSPLLENMDCHPDLVLLCERIDSIRMTTLANKPLSEIGFFDFEDMDRHVTKAISSVYRDHGIELCPLDEYLTMSCWLAGERAVLAFPSKWASDEIGFYSQDRAFARYISTMLMGVKSQRPN